MLPSPSIPCPRRSGPAIVCLFQLGGSHISSSSKLCAPNQNTCKAPQTAKKQKNVELHLATRGIENKVADNGGPHEDDCPADIVDHRAKNGLAFCSTSLLREKRSGFRVARLGLGFRAKGDLAKSDTGYQFLRPVRPCTDSRALNFTSPRHDDAEAEHVANDQLESIPLAAETCKSARLLLAPAAAFRV